MKNKSHARINSLIPNFRYIATPVVLGLCLVQSATADITTWTGATDNNWSTVGNWDNGLPGGNDAVFADADATGSTGPSGIANNIVDADTTVTSLKYTTLETTGYHTTEIPTGLTLTVNGGGTNIEVQSPTTGTTDVVYATILGEGTLAVNNAAATLYVGQGADLLNATRRSTLDMSGLEAFSGTLSQLVVGRQATSSLPNRPQGTLKLARNNTLSLSGSPGIQLGFITSAGGTGIAQILELGVSNTILNNSGIVVGGRKGTAKLSFNTETVGLGEGSAVFRDSSGSGRQANWLIGDNSAQSGGGTFARGEVNFSQYGEVDALVDNIVLGNATAGTTTTSNECRGILTFDSGTIDTNSLTAGIQPDSTDPGATTGTVNVDGTGKLVVNGGVTLGRYFGTAYNSRGFINIGTLSGGGDVRISGDVICGTGTGTATRITLTDGSLTLGGQVGDDSLAGNAPLTTLQLNGGTLTFDFGSAPNPAGSRAKVTNLNVPNSVTLNIEGANLSPGTIELVKYTNFFEATEFANLNLTLPPRVVANLVNNTANGSVDLDISSVSVNKWSGTVNSDWDINTTFNWALFPGNTSSTYEQTGVPGEPVIFDDTATGTKTVNLTTILSPSRVLVETNDTYTFTGPGAISGTGELLKQGSGTLVLDTDNDYTGATSISAGTLEVRGSIENSSGITNDASLVFNSDSARSYGNAIGGSGSLTKQGAGTLILSGNNTYTGPTTVSQGILQIGIGTIAGTLGDDSDTFIDTGAELRIERSTDGFGYTYYGQLSGTGTVNVPADRRFNFRVDQTNSGDLAFTIDGTLGIYTPSGVTAVALGELSGSGIIQRAGAAPTSPPPTVITIGGKNTSSTYSGNINNVAEFAIEKVGSGTLTLEGTSGHGGTTVINSGTLALGAAAAIPNSSSFTIAVGAVLDTSAQTTFAMAATQPFAYGIDPAGAGTSGTLSAQGLDITNAVVTLDISDTLDDPAYVLATYTGLTGTQFATEPAIPSGYELKYDYQGDKIALVQSGAGGAYVDWATLNSAGPNLEDDHDGDGVSNGIEYFLGGPNGNTTGFTPLPGVTNTGGILSVTWTKGTDYTGTYGTDFQVETSATLANPWTAETVGGNVTLSGDDVIYTFPAGSKNFARLKVTGP